MHFFFNASNSLFQFISKKSSQHATKRLPVVEYFCVSCFVVFLSSIVNNEIKILVRKKIEKSKTKLFVPSPEPHYTNDTTNNNLHVWNVISMIKFTNSVLNQCRAACEVVDWLIFATKTCIKIKNANIWCFLNFWIEKHCFWSFVAKSILSRAGVDILTNFGNQIKSN